MANRLTDKQKYELMRAWDVRHDEMVKANCSRAEAAVLLAEGLGFAVTSDQVDNLVEATGKPLGRVKAPSPADALRADVAALTALVQELSGRLAATETLLTRTLRSLTGTQAGMCALGRALLKVYHHSRAPMPPNLEKLLRSMADMAATLAGGEEHVYEFSLQLPTQEPPQPCK